MIFDAKNICKDVKYINLPGERIRLSEGCSWSQPLGSGAEKPQWRRQGV
jgi:hypothetical protein